MAGNQNPGYPNVVAGRSTADNAPTDVSMDVTSGALYNGIWVWNTSTLIWEKMTQPKTTDTSEQYVFDDPDWVEMTQPKTTDNAEVYGYNGTNWHEARIDTSTRAFNTIDYAHHEVHSGSKYYIEGYAELGIGGTLFVKLVTPAGGRWSHFLWEIGSSGILTTTLDEDAAGGMAGGLRPTIHSNNRNVGCWTGLHTGADNQATVMTDATKAFTVDALIGYQIFNTTDGSSGIITDNDATTVTVASLAGGTGNDWDTNDKYEINNSQLVITSGVTVATGYTQRISNIKFGSKAAGGSHSRNDEIILKQNTVYLRSFTSNTASAIIPFKAEWYEHTDKAA